MHIRPDRIGFNIHQVKILVKILANLRLYIEVLLSDFEANLYYILYIIVEAERKERGFLQLRRY